MKYRIIVRFADPKRKPFVGRWFWRWREVLAQRRAAGNLWGDDIKSVEIEEGV